jgi:hypothetical protein
MAADDSYRTSLPGFVDGVAYSSLARVDSVDHWLAGADDLDQSSAASFTHYGTQSRCRRLTAFGTVKKAVGIGCTDGGRGHLIVGIGGRRHRTEYRRHRYAIA